MEDLSRITEYREFKQMLDVEMKQAVESFVRIGYLLKRARDTNILLGSRYKTVTEFAQAEYNLDKSQVSRFIAINDRFSENGYSDRLQVKYQRFGLAKLQEMLQLPDSIIDELKPEMTRTSIQEIKKEVQAEEQITDIEVMLEPDEAEVVSSMAEKTLYIYFHSNIEKYETVYEKACQSKFTIVRKEEVAELFAPTGTMAEFVRISGIGKILITLDADTSVFTFTNVRNGEKESLDGLEVFKIFRNMFTPTYAKPAKGSWQQLYKEQYPKADKTEAEAKPATKKNEVSKKMESLENGTSKDISKDNDIKVEKDNEQNSTLLQESKAEVVSLESNEDINEQVQQPVNAINTEYEDTFTTNKSTTYRDTVFEEMAAVSNRLSGYIENQDIEMIEHTIKDLNNMLNSIIEADKNNDIIGQMSICDIQESEE